jgi:hypothetical protein
MVVENAQLGAKAGVLSKNGWNLPRVVGLKNGWWRYGEDGGR